MKDRRQKMQDDLVEEAYRDYNKMKKESFEQMLKRIVKENKEILDALAKV